MGAEVPEPATSLEGEGPALLIRYGSRARVRPGLYSGFGGDASLGGNKFDAVSLEVLGRPVVVWGILTGRGGASSCCFLCLLKKLEVFFCRVP